MGPLACAPPCLWLFAIGIVSRLQPIKTACGLDPKGKSPGPEGIALLCLVLLLLLLYPPLLVLLLML